MSKRIVSPLAQLLAALVFATLPLEQALSKPATSPRALPMFLSIQVAIVNRRDRVLARTGIYRYKDA